MRDPGTKEEPYRVAIDGKGEDGSRFGRGYAAVCPQGVPWVVRVRRPLQEQAGTAVW